MNPSTEEERKAAAEKVASHNRYLSKKDIPELAEIWLADKPYWETRCIDLQIQLTRKEKRLEEAEGLLRKSLEFIRMPPGTELVIRAFLDPPAEGE